jgi:hypothetical protein
MTFEDDERDNEETTCAEGEKDDGVTVGSLGCGRCGGGVVQALGAALGVREWRQEQHKSDQKRCKA